MAAAPLWLAASLQGRILFPGDGSSFSELGLRFQPVPEDQELGCRRKGEKGVAWGAAAVAHGKPVPSDAPGEVVCAFRAPLPHRRHC